MRATQRRTKWLGLVSMATALTGCAGTGALHQGSIPRGAHYVATGSSFAAGAGIAPGKAGPGRCARSARSYASLLAARLGLNLDDQTCSGARTTHLLGPWNELPAQLDAIGADTRLVTATIGGNDINYAGYLTSAGCGADGMVAIGTNRMPCRPSQVPTEADYAQLERNMREIVRRAKARAPRARVIFVQYVSLVPDRPCEAANLPPDKAPVAREIGRRLAEITARAARLEGGEVLSADELSRAHGPCDAEPWAFGTKATAGEGVIWHPSARGHQGIADALAERLGEGGR
jgi:lysophospholipase L1-like esterase